MLRCLRAVVWNETIYTRIGAWCALICKKQDGEKGWARRRKPKYVQIHANTCIYGRKYCNTAFQYMILTCQYPIDTC
jgi:hypothetical protein